MRYRHKKPVVSCHKVQHQSCDLNLRPKSRIDSWNHHGDQNIDFATENQESSWIMEGRSVLPFFRDSTEWFLVKINTLLRCCDMWELIKRFLMNPECNKDFVWSSLDKPVSFLRWRYLVRMVILRTFSAPHCPLLTISQKQFQGISRMSFYSSDDERSRSLKSSPPL
jgi:hypothetical protein